MSHESALAAAAPTPVAPVEAPIEGAAPTEIESTRFAHLTKKETELQKQREEYKKEREALTAEKTKLTEVQKQLEAYEKAKTTDPVAALKLLGFSEKDVQAYMDALANPGTPEEKARKAVQDELQRFKDEQAKQEASVTEKRNAEAIASFKKDIGSVVASDKDKYEFCNYYGALAEELIYETVSAVLQESGDLIPASEAADMVEQYYEEQAKAMKALKKLQAKEEVAEEKLVAKIPEATKSAPAKTLTAKTTATTASTTITKKETSSEKRERLIKMLRPNP